MITPASRGGHPLPGQRREPERTRGSGSPRCRRASLLGDIGQGVVGGRHPRRCSPGRRACRSARRSRRPDRKFVPPADVNAVRHCGATGFGFDLGGGGHAVLVIHGWRSPHRRRSARGEGHLPQPAAAAGHQHDPVGEVEQPIRETALTGVASPGGGVQVLLIRARYRCAVRSVRVGSRTRPTAGSRPADCPRPSSGSASAAW